jgi:serine/threonine protein kinase
MTESSAEERLAIGDRLGAGAATEAFRARRFGAEGFEKPVVYKRVHARLSAKPAFVEEFVARTRLASELVHTNIVSIIDGGRTESEDGPILFLVTELVDGIDLATLFERAQGRGITLPAHVAAYLVEEIAKALDHAHRRRKGAVVHGGLSPSNVLLSWNGDVKVSDFGVHAALVTAGMAPDPRRALPYRAPEALRSEPPTVASDMFSLGAIADESATLEAAFFCGDIRDARPTATLAGTRGSPVGDALAELVPRLVGAPPERPMAAEVHDVLFKARAKSGRTDSAASELKDLVAALGHAPPSA